MIVICVGRLVCFRSEWNLIHSDVIQPYSDIRDPKPKPGFILQSKNDRIISIRFYVLRQSLSTHWSTGDGASLCFTKVKRKGKHAAVCSAHLHASLVLLHLDELLSICSTKLSAVRRSLRAVCARLFLSFAIVSRNAHSSHSSAVCGIHTSSAEVK